jgi:hypothetical protein
MRYVMLLLCVGLAGCGPSRTSGVRIDSALERLVPGDATVLAGVRLDALRATPFYKKWVGERSVPFLDRWSEESGFDPRKDLQEMLVVSDGVQTAILARGKFDEKALRAAQEGYTLKILNPTTLVAGRTADVQWIIDQRGRSSGPPSALSQELSTIPAQSQIWLAATGGFGELSKAMPQSGNASNLAKVFSMIKSATASVDFANGLKLAASGVCRTDQDAHSLSDAVRGMVALARLNTPAGNSEMLEVYDGIKTEQQQRTVKVTASLSEAQLDELLTQLSSFGSSRAPRP